jgi:hypothetical protein
MSIRALIIEQLRRHPGRGQNASEIAHALNLPDGRSVALQLKWLERQGVVCVARRGRGSRSMDAGGPQWMLPLSERAYKLMQKKLRWPGRRGGLLGVSIAHRQEPFGTA